MAWFRETWDETTLYFHKIPEEKIFIELRDQLIWFRFSLSSFSSSFLLFDTSSNFNTIFARSRLFFSLHWILAYVLKYTHSWFFRKSNIENRNIWVLSIFKTSNHLQRIFFQKLLIANRKFICIVKTSLKMYKLATNSILTIIRRRLVIGFTKGYFVPRSYVLLFVQLRCSMWKGALISERTFTLLAPVFAKFGFSFRWEANFKRL